MSRAEAAGDMVAIRGRVCIEKLVNLKSHFICNNNYDKYM